MVVVIVNLKILIISNDHSIASILGIIISMLTYLISFVILTNFLYPGAQLY